MGEWVPLGTSLLKPFMAPSTADYQSDTIPDNNNDTRTSIHHSHNRDERSTNTTTAAISSLLS
eukprot:scaffold455314_cov14-Prasinocladus_malaysianus.AAC.1